MKHCADQAVTDAKELESKLKQRLEWFDLEMLRSIIVFLDTQTWCAIVDSMKSDVEVDDHDLG